MDPEAHAEAATPLKTNNVFMRRSTRVFRDRQPTEGAAGGIFAFCCSLIFALIILALVNALSVACIVIGVMYLDKENCPGEQNIAPVLIASGVLAIFLSIFEGRSRVMTAKDGETEETETKDGCYYFMNVVRLAKTILFIYLCVLVFSLSPHVKYEPYPLEPDAVNYYCNATLFLFSYWLILFVIIFSCIVIATFCCCCCCIALAAGVSK